MIMILLRGYFKINDIRIKNTKFDFWKNLKVGDVLEIVSVKTYETKHANKYRFTNLRTKEKYEGRDNYLYKTDYEEIVPINLKQEIINSFNKERI